MNTNMRIRYNRVAHAAAIAARFNRCKPRHTGGYGHERT